MIVNEQLLTLELGSDTRIGRGNKLRIGHFALNYKHSPFSRTDIMDVTGATVDVTSRTNKAYESAGLFHPEYQAGQSRKVLVADENLGSVLQVYNDIHLRHLGVITGLPYNDLATRGVSALAVSRGYEAGLPPDVLSEAMDMHPSTINYLGINAIAGAWGLSADELYRATPIRSVEDTQG